MSFKVPGTLLHSVNTDALLESAFQTDLTSATRRHIEDSRKRGITLSDREARDDVLKLHAAGHADILPHYTRVANRIRNR
jgi:hypothetical protein